MYSFDLFFMSNGGHFEKYKINLKNISRYGFLDPNYIRNDLSNSSRISVLRKLCRF